MKFILIMCCSVALVFSGAVNAQKDVELAIEETYYEWAAAANAKDIERWSTFLAPEAIFLPPDSGALNTHESIRNYYLESFADPNFTLHCKQHSIEIAASGDIAWSTGKCESTFTGSSGEKESGKSKWAKVWAKQSDGSWKGKLNIWNKDPS